MEIEISGYKVQIDEEDYEKIYNLKWYVDTAMLKRGYVYFYHAFYLGNNKHYNMSLQRFLLGMTRGDGLFGDHINGDTLDNRKCNLRICTAAENSRNIKRAKNNTTGFKGVTYVTSIGKYRASITYNQKFVDLGYFITSEEAYAAYCEASKKYHGNFGRVE